MIKLYKNGAWLTEGQEPVSDETGLEQKFHLSKQEAKKIKVAWLLLACSFLSVATCSI